MLKQQIKTAANRLLQPYFNDSNDKAMRVDKGTQILLMLKYQEMLRNRVSLPSIDDVGFRNYSQFDEDGILLFLFSVIGTTNRISAEMCAGDGTECNTANLILHHRWNGVLFDGSPDNIQDAKTYYERHPDSRFMLPKLVNAWIDLKSVNNLLSDQGLKGEIDLFSLDMDGVDWHIWKAIECIDPRVVVLEYNNGWGTDDSYTVPYSADFRWGEPLSYFGASLAAFKKLGEAKGYRLVGCNKVCNNAFFVRNDVAPSILPAVSLASCLRRTSLDLQSIRSIPSTKDQKWVEV